jgi:hypothetical protein
MACCCRTCGCDFELPFYLSLSYSAMNAVRFNDVSVCTIDMQFTASGSLTYRRGSPPCRWDGHASVTTQTPPPSNPFGGPGSPPTVFVAATLYPSLGSMYLNIEIIVTENSFLAYTSCGKSFSHYLTNAWYKTVVVKTYDGTAPGVIDSCPDSTFFPNLSGLSDSVSAPLQGTASISFFNSLP